MNHINYLISLGACQSGIDMAAKFPSLSQAWEACENPQYMFWLLRKTEKITKEQAVDIAIQCAERALPRWEEKHPEDTLSRKAIDSAKAWLKEPTEENRLAAGKAAYAAADADVFFVSAAAYASAVAAAAAAATAIAAAVAAVAAYAAVADATFADELKAQADIIRSVVGNPFKDI